MSDGEHVHDESCQGGVIVCFAGPFKYQVAVHRRGKHSWESIGKPHRTIASAFQALGKALQESSARGWPDYNRAGIWAVEPPGSYYDPHQVYEVTVR